ncbi:MAG: radical SAM protein [Planctomycetes bacterium]|nr:radical SAM protein [Planctomycetota bacterium]MCB9891799.1 radical SAM protein [Planctomycetota bacterium]
MNPVRPTAPYTFLGQTTSLCEECLALVPTKILAEAGQVWFRKHCREHGHQRTLVSTDETYYRNALQYLKPGDRPRAFQTTTQFGCPWDCGLCPDHEQHSCLVLIDVNEACNLTCPVCFSESSTEHTSQRSLAEIERMMDAAVRSEGVVDLLQLSGGEPSIHPHILDILRMARSKAIRHVMMNTNGVRIAAEPAFAAELSSVKPGFEVYLQFDSLEPTALETLRGADLTAVRRRALERLEEHQISTTLVVVVKRGVNEHELGRIVDHALQFSCVRGVVFQPIQDAGRNEGFAKRDRVVLSEIRSRLLEQSTVFTDQDLIPLPCNPESISIGYGLRNGTQVAPLTGMLPRDALLAITPNAITFEKDERMRASLRELFSLSTGALNLSERLEALLCCLPQVAVPEGIGYEHTFRVAIVEFLDRFNFCIGRVKRSCVHFATPEGRMIPIDTYNLFYRDGRIDEPRQLERRSSRGKETT